MERVVTKFHAMQLFTDTFAAETVHLTNDQVGIYIRLLNFHWTKNAKPFTANQAKRICQCKSAECDFQVDEILREFFVYNETDENWTHKRVVQEYEYLIAKYKRKSEAGRKGGVASSKKQAPIPIPKPIPNNNIYDEFFLEHWKNLHIKRGSKFTANKAWLKVSPEIPENLDVAAIYNRQVFGIEDKFVPHFSTWLNERRWEINENDEKRSESPTIIEKMTRLKYQHIGQEAHFDIFQKDGKKYKIDRYDKDHLIQDA